MHEYWRQILGSIATAETDHTHSISSIATIPPYRGYYFIEYVGA